jgi:hypothetical protein
VPEQEERRLVGALAPEARDQVRAESGRVVALHHAAAALELAREALGDGADAHGIARRRFEGDQRFEEGNARVAQLARPRGQLQGIDQGAFP